MYPKKSQEIHGITEILTTTVIDYSLTVLQYYSVLSEHYACQQYSITVSSRSVSSAEHYHSRHEIIQRKLASSAVDNNSSIRENLILGILLQGHLPN